MNDLYYLHSNEYSSEPDVIVSAPGVVNLIGEHTDYNDGVTIELGIDRCVSVALTARDDNILRFFAADLEERKRTTIPNLKYKREDRWANYPKGVVYEIMQLGYPIGGFDMTIRSAVPSGVGLGASAGLAVATAAAVSELYSIELSEFQIVQCAAMAESDFMGINTALSDHLTSAVSRKDTVVFLDLRTLKYEHLSLNLEEFVLLITNSNVPYASTGAEFQEREQKCAEGLSYLHRKRNGRGLRDYTIDDLDSSMGMVSEEIRRTCVHVIEETERVWEAKKQIVSGNVAGLGKLLNQSHESLRDNYEVSCPEIDWLVKRAWELDCVYGSRMAGPGFGGCTISLLKDNVIGEYFDRLSDYERIFGFTPEVFTFQPSDGVQVTLPTAKTVKR